MADTHFVGYLTGLVHLCAGRFRQYFRRGPRVGIGSGDGEVKTSYIIQIHALVLLPMQYWCDGYMVVEFRIKGRGPADHVLPWTFAHHDNNTICVQKSYPIVITV